MSSNPEIKEVKHIGDGKIAVRWKGKRKFVIVDDATISTYLVYAILNKDSINKEKRVAYH